MIFSCERAEGRDETVCSAATRWFNDLQFNEFLRNRFALELCCFVWNLELSQSCFWVTLHRLICGGAEPSQELTSWIKSVVEGATQFIQYCAQRAVRPQELEMVRQRTTDRQRERAHGQPILMRSLMRPLSRRGGLFIAGVRPINYLTSPFRRAVSATPTR